MTARARLTDPVTSHEAAASLTNLRQSQLEVHRLVKTYGPCTDGDLIWIALKHGLAISDSGLRTRRSELVDMGWVRDSGQRQLTSSGRRAILWEACVAPDWVTS